MTKQTTIVVIGALRVKTDSVQLKAILGTYEDISKSFEPNIPYNDTWIFSNIIPINTCCPSHRVTNSTSLVIPPIYEVCVGI